MMKKCLSLLNYFHGRGKELESARGGGEKSYRPKLKSIR